MRSPSAPNPSPIEQRQSAETTTSATGSFRVAHGRPQSWGSEYLQEPALGALELLIWRLDRSGRSFARASCTRGAAGAAGRACAGVLQVALVERRGCSHGGALVCCARSMILFSFLATQPPAGSQHAPCLQPVITTWVPGCAVWAASENNGAAMRQMRQPYSARGWRHEAAATHEPPAAWTPWPRAAAQCRSTGRRGR